MATKEAVAQLAVLPERVSVLETQVDNINEKLVDLKADVKQMHDCLDNTRDLIDKKLDEMMIEYRENRNRYYQVLEDNKTDAEIAHAALADKISNLEKLKLRATIGMVAVIAFISGTGYLTLEQIAKVVVKLS
jgi:predicted phage-related endonuclease